MGRLTSERPLLPIRAAAAELAVNYHTVRQAYAELVRLGVATSVRRRGTVVRDDALPRYPVAGSDSCVAAECNFSQAAQLARELHDAAGAPVVPWQLDWPEPPPGKLVTTTFHAGEVRSRWPLRQVCDVPLAPHESLAELIQARAAALRLEQAVVVERDPDTGCALAAEVAPLLRASGLDWRAATATSFPKLLARSARAVVLVAPRVFDGLPWRLQSHPRVIEVRCVVAPRAWPRLHAFLAKPTGR